MIMKNKTGIIIGFLAGSIGFLLLFKIIFLDHIKPEDELAPGVVIMVAIALGIFCAFAGSLVQEFFRREKKL